MSDGQSLESMLIAAVKAAGGQSAYARVVGKHQSTISQRLRDGGCIQPDEVLKVEAATGISRHDQRPDIYPRESIADDHLEGLRA